LNKEWEEAIATAEAMVARDLARYQADREAARLRKKRRRLELRRKRRMRRPEPTGRDGDKGDEQGLHPPYDPEFLQKISHVRFSSMVFS
jgi:Ni/Co efflux regulator RcnB